MRGSASRGADRRRKLERATAAAAAAAARRLRSRRLHRRDRGRSVLRGEARERGRDARCPEGPLDHAHRRAARGRRWRHGAPQPHDQEHQRHGDDALLGDAASSDGAAHRLVAGRGDPRAAPDGLRGPAAALSDDDDGQPRPRRRCGADDSRARPYLHHRRRSWPSTSARAERSRASSHGGRCAFRRPLPQ